MVTRSLESATRADQHELEFTRAPLAAHAFKHVRNEKLLHLHVAAEFHIAAVGRDAEQAHARFIGGSLAKRDAKFLDD